MRIDRDVRLLLAERLMLRRSLPEDAEAIAAYRSDPDVYRYQGWERTDAEGIAREIGEMATRAPGEPGGWAEFTVCGRAGGWSVTWGSPGSRASRR